jgi:hypothetical protein
MAALASWPANAPRCRHLYPEASKGDQRLPHWLAAVEARIMAAEFQDCSEGAAQLS